MAYYRRAMKPGLAKFVRFAKNVWDINGERLRVGDGTSGIGMTDEQIPKQVSKP